MISKVGNTKKAKLDNVIYKNENMQENIYTNNENFCNENTNACHSPKFSTPCCVTNVLELLQFCQNLFMIEHIPLFISFETLYSFTINNSLDINQNSIQMMSLLSFVNEIELFREKMESMNYVLIRHNEKKYDKAIEYFTIYYSNINKNCIQIHLLDDTKSKNYFLFTDKKNKLFYPNHIFLLQNIKLSGIDTFIPSNPNMFISMLYDDGLPIIKSPAIGLKNKTLNQLISNNDYNIYCCHIINHFKSHDRLHRVISECDKYNLYAKRVDAVMGRTLDREELIKNGFLIESPKFRKLRMNEIGVFMSHIKIWKEISDLPDESWHLILEDDTVFRSSFDSTMKKVKENLKTISWDIVFLGFNLFNKLSIQEIKPFIYKTGFSWGTYAYIITPRSAKLLLKDIFPIKYPIDEVITIGDPQFEEARKAFDSRFNNKIIKYCIMNTNDIYTWSNGGNYGGLIDPTIGNSTTKVSDYVIQNDINIRELFVCDSILFETKNILKNIVELFINEKLVYIVSGDTLLDTIRHHNIAPWNDKYIHQMCIFETDEILLISLSDKMRNIGYYMECDWFGYRISYNDNRSIDIYLIRDFGNKYHFASKKARDLWPKNYILKEYLFPLKEYKYDDIYLAGPNDALAHLYQIYGINWRTYAVVLRNNNVSISIPQNLRHA